MELWVDFYARDYGGFGVVMAIFFWIGFSSFVIVAARASRRCSPSGAGCEVTLRRRSALSIFLPSARH